MSSDRRSSPPSKRSRRRSPPAAADGQRPDPTPVSDRKLHAMIALVVVGLTLLVWWALPGEGSRDPGVASTDDAAVDEEDAGAPGALPRLPEAALELAVLTAKPEGAVRALAAAAEIGKRLEARHCGSACDAVKKLASDPEAFEIEIRKTADLLLPPRDTFDTVAPGLSPKERDSVSAHETAVLVRTHGETSADQMAARAAFAAVGVLVEALDGLLYDEAARRIQTAADARALAITVPLGAPAFDRRHIVIQSYRDEEGAARLATLGLERFGSPDLSIRGANPSSAPMLAEVVNAAASKIASGKDALPISVGLDDVARVIGRKPAEISTHPAGARTAELGITRPARVEGDPDNELVELVPAGGSTREAWDGVVAGIFGLPPVTTTSADDKELTEIANKARRELPSAIKRFESGEGELFVKGPFAIPVDSRVDGGPQSELLWLAVASCDAERCTGVLSNEPTYATNIALGKTTSVAARDVADWVIQRRDGKTVGGESIKALKARAAR